MVPIAARHDAVGTSLALALLLACSSCGRSGFDLLDAATLDDASDIDATVDATADAGPPGVGVPIVFLDAEDVSGSGDPGATNCPSSASSEWKDLATGSAGVLLNFAEPPCGGQSGWQGSGSPSDPHRLHLLAAAQQGVPFGTIGATGDHTVEAWIRWSGGGVDSTTGNGGVDVYPIVSRGVAEIEVSDVDINYYLAISSGTETIVGEFEGNIDHMNHAFEGSTTLEAGRWYHLAITYDHAEQALYVNGALDDSRPETDPTPSAADSILSVGAGYESTGVIDGGFFDGDIAIVRIYDRALSAAEIKVECEAFAARFMGLGCDP